MTALDPFSIVMTYATTNGKLLFSLFALGVSFFVNKTISGALFTFSILSFLLYFMYSDAMLIALAGLALVIGFFMKNVGQ